MPSTGKVVKSCKYLTVLRGISVLGFEVQQYKMTEGYGHVRSCACSPLGRHSSAKSTCEPLKDCQQLLARLFLTFFSMFTLEAQKFGFVYLKNKFSVFKIKVFKAQNKAKKPKAIQKNLSRNDIFIDFIIYLVGLIILPFTIWHYFKTFCLLCITDRMHYKLQKTKIMFLLKDCNVVSSLN